MNTAATRQKDPKPVVRIVFPPDQRQAVNPTTGPNYRVVGQLEMTFPNDVTYAGTGILLDQTHVLTCAHNLFDNSIGGWATQVTFTPARNGALAPFGQFVAAGNGLFVPEIYRHLSPPNPNDPNWAVPATLQEVSRYMHDYGVVRLSQMVNIDDFNGMFPASDQQLQQAVVDITGYPGDKPPGTMWHASGQLTMVSAELLFHQISTYRGQSGSPLRTTIQGLNPPNWPWIVGIHVAGSAQLGVNWAVRLTQDVIDEVLGWMEA